MADNPWNVSESALKIIEQRQRGWPGDLFCQVLIDEVNASKHLISSPPVGTRPKIELAGTDQWIDNRVSSLVRVATDCGTWLHSDYEPFFGKTNEGLAGQDEVKFVTQIPWDASWETTPKVIAISRKLSAVYRQAIEWSHSVRNADVHPVFREATYELSFMADTVLRFIESFGPAILSMLNSCRESEKSGVPAQAVEVRDFEMKPWNADRYLKALATANQRLQSGVAGADAAPAPGRAGYLYILTNPSLGNMIKIGKTTRSPRDRIDELSAATAIPTPFVLAFDAYVEDCDTAEAYVHARLEKDGYRVAKNREFFNVDLATAIAVVLESQKEQRNRSERDRESRQ